MLLLNLHPSNIPRPKNLPIRDSRNRFFEILGRSPILAGPPLFRAMSATSTIEWTNAAIDARRPDF